MQFIRLAFLFCSLILFPSFFHAQTQKDEESQTLGFSLRDIFAFETASDMYPETPQSPYSEKAEKLLNEITTYLDTNPNATIEHKDVWGKLIQLEPYRTTEQVQKAIKPWIERTASQLPDLKDTALKEKMIAISKAYKEEDFKKTAVLCLQVSSRRNYDARNNLALALMHLNYDLAAQVELEILKNINSDYLPGLINLTVVYERLGKEREAKVLAERVKTLTDMRHIDLPMSRFNAAWYLNKEGRYAAADKILSDPVALKDTVIPKYNALRTLNLKQLAYEKEHPDILKLLQWGLVKSTGTIDDGNYLAIAILTFILLSLILIPVFRSILEKRRYAKNRKKWLVAFFLFLCAALLYILVWGVPTEGVLKGWFVIYLLIFFFVLRRKYKQIKQ